MVGAKKENSAQFRREGAALSLQIPCPCVRTQALRRGAQVDTSFVYNMLDWYVFNEPPNAACVLLLLLKRRVVALR